MKKVERGISRVRATTTLIWLAALAGACGSTASTTTIQIGSESHFLTYCDQTCGGGFECIGGICTRSCLTEGTSCAGLGAAVECTNESVEPGAVAVCDAPCGGHADCSGLGAGYQCSAGFCRYSGSPALGEGASGCPTPDPTSGGYVTLESQADVDALEGCTAIRGNLDIRPFEGADLRPLGALTTIAGSLRIGSASADLIIPALPSLEGLESVREIVSLELRGVLAQSLTGLRGLRRFLPVPQGLQSGLVNIAQCPELTDLRGLENLVGLTSLYLRRSPLARSVPLAGRRSLRQRSFR